MFIPSKTKIKVGDRIVLTQALVMEDGTFTVGHLFTVVGEGERGFDLVDFDGRKVGETIRIQHTFKKVSE